MARGNGRIVLFRTGLPSTRQCTRSRKLPWREIRVINANSPPAKCALQFLIGHIAFLIAIRVQDIWTSMGMHGKVGRFESNVELYLSAIIRRFIERVRKLIRVWKSITIIVTTRWILERICLKMFGSFITIKIRWREIFNRDSRLFVRCFVKAVKRDRECIVFVFKQMWSNFSYRNWFRSELIIVIWNL